MALSPSADTARIFADGLAQSASRGCHGRKRCKQWRDRVMFLRKAEGDSLAGSCPMTRLPRSARRGWCRRCTTRRR